MDRSLQRYIQIVSSGIAWISGEVFPVVAANDDDTVGAGLSSLPTSHGYNHAVIVIPHSVGPHRSGFAWYDGPPVNGIHNFARVAMFTNQGLTARKNLGVWVMEVLHAASSFGDLYFTSPMIGQYDSMACSCGTHLSAHTKSSIGWVRNEGISVHPTRSDTIYTLHAVSLFQPAPFRRTTAVHVASRLTTGHFMIEARLRTDQYESSSEVSSGIPAEGVIVYEVQGLTEVYLRTNIALQPGDTWEDAEEKLKVTVVSAEAGGFNVRINSGKASRCKQLATQIESLQINIDLENDIFKKKQLISALQRAKAEYRRLGCLLIHNPANEVFDSTFFGVGAKGGSKYKG